jgi:hypothetical protein
MVKWIRVTIVINNTIPCFLFFQWQLSLSDIAYILLIFFYIYFLFPWKLYGEAYNSA